MQHSERGSVISDCLDVLRHNYVWWLLYYICVKRKHISTRDINSLLMAKNKLAAADTNI